MLKHEPSMMLKHCSSIMRTHCSEHMHVRTYGRTNEELLTIGLFTSVTSRAQGGREFSPIGGEK